MIASFLKVRDIHSFSIEYNLDYIKQELSKIYLSTVNKFDE